jgi:hypothetical protein
MKQLIEINRLGDSKCVISTVNKAAGANIDAFSLSALGLIDYRHAMHSVSLIAGGTATQAARAAEEESR